MKTTLARTILLGLFVWLCVGGLRALPDANASAEKASIMPKIPEPAQVVVTAPEPGDLTPQALGVLHSHSTGVTQTAVLDFHQAVKAARMAGFSGEGLSTALAIARAESHLRPLAQLQNPPTKGCANGSIDRGLWQINDCYHAEVSDACAYDPMCAAHEAFRISHKGTQWKWWSSWWAKPRAKIGPGSGPFTKHLVIVQTALAESRAWVESPSPSGLAQLAGTLTGAELVPILP